MLYFKSYDAAELLFFGIIKDLRLPILFEFVCRKFRIVLLSSYR